MHAKRRTSRGGKIAANFAIAVLGLTAGLFVVSGLYKGCASPVDPRRAVDSSHLIGEYIQLEVFNGCGRDGLASDMTRYLRSRGFDVVMSGNYHRFGVDETRVIARTSDNGAAVEVLKALALPLEEVQSEPDPSRYVDVSVVVGCDYNSIPPFVLEDKTDR